MASIRVMQGPDKGRSYELRDGQNIIGRQTEDVQLADGTISRNHCRVMPDDGQWVLEDMGSANGTFLNGMKIKKTSPLKRGDQIRCGSSLLVFSTAQTTAAGNGGVDIDEKGNLVDAAIVATVPSNEDSVVIPTPEAGARAIDHLQILYQLIAESASIFDVEELLRHVVERTHEVIEADRSYALLLNPDGEILLRVSRLEEDIPTGELPISRTIINEVLRNQVGVLSSNAMNDRRFHSGKSIHNFGIRSALCVPIKGRDAVLGILYVDSRVADRTYTTEQLRLMTAIGVQTGLEIENVHLHRSAVATERLAAVGETVAYLSHHIKNILHALSSGTDVVEMGLVKGDLDKARNAWPIVQRNLGRINELILNMLAFGKDREPLPEPTDLNEILTDCVELVTPQADERGVAVMSELAEMPKLTLDQAGMRQAMLNLVNNALDAVDDETGIITVSTQHDTMNREVIVKVIDNGMGIAPDKLDDIFTPFFSQKGQKGTGLGLAVTRKVVNENDGDIFVESEIGKGTTFTIILPTIPPGPEDTHAGHRH